MRTLDRKGLTVSCRCDLGDSASATPRLSAVRSRSLGPGVAALERRGGVQSALRALEDRKAKGGWLPSAVLTVVVVAGRRSLLVRGLPHSPDQSSIPVRLSSAFARPLAFLPFLLPFLIGHRA